MLKNKDTARWLNPPPLSFFLINLQFTNSNLFQFLIHVTSQINCNLQSTICYCPKELMKTKSSKKIWYQGHSSKWPYLTNLDSFLREQTSPGLSISTLVTLILHKFIVNTCAYVINLFYPPTRTLVRFCKKKNYHSELIANIPFL